MDPNKQPPNEQGRSFLLELMKKRAQMQRSQALSHSLETPSVSSAEQTSRSSEGYSSHASSSSGGRGRAQLSSWLKSLNSSSSEESRDSSLAIGHGRGAIPRLIRKLGKPSTSFIPESVSKDDSEGVLGKLADISVYDNPPSPEDLQFSDDIASICRQGKSGMKIEAYCNYVDLILEPGKGLFQYEIKFSPNIDSIGLRRKLLNQHSVALGRTRIFDGTLLYLPIKLSQNVSHYKSEHPMDGSKVILTIIFKKKGSMCNVQFFNVLINRIMRALSLVRIGRQNFNPKGAHALPQHRLEVWPGYVTAVNEYEGGLKLCLDAKHRVMRTETVRDLIREIFQKSHCNYQDAVINEIVGTSVLTRYNNKTYRIDDVAFNKTPTDTFSKNDEQISYIDYYKTNWNIQIEDVQQPLLVHRDTVRLSNGEKEERTIYLIPELSYAAGLTDNIRNNHYIMKDLSGVTKMSPNQRRDVVRRFLEEVQRTDVTREILSEWGLHLSSDLVRFTARQLEPEMIRFGNNKTFKTNERADWSSAAVRNPVLRTPNLSKWNIIYFIKDRSCIVDFLNQLSKVAIAINMRIDSPKQVALRDDRTETYLREIQNNLTDNLELLVIVFPTNRTDRYSAIKKLCCVQKAIPSQVIISKTISKPTKLRSITEKIALQINCKLGGALWTLTLPLKNCMICGIDVYHAGVGGGSRKSVAGFIASLDTQLTKWHSRICMQASKQELVDMLQVCLTSAINAFYKYNGCNPERIIIYRDGVGDGDLDYVENYEVKQLLATFNRIAPNYKPQLSVIIVQKRINTRIFIKGRDGLDNPAPGTIVDSCITKRNYYDFFLVPQNVRQGTVTPTHYIVIHDSSNIETDHMQRLTYKLCHLYYNWPGTIRVPAPCQYAHKLVYLVGQNLLSEPHQSLSDILFYL
ncbi:PREDICTED: protein argonaute-3 [Acromyrmex echinatior]|uniref:Piwi-like protein 2 n=1 Tax=Acromyrmex echinatior TaxID=103372 RepID=F4W6N0_ACREC|nr:PREDICTED: protein argonaute-3 [Acromyrmex echinatior]EGI70106.1 Piwi-like protein 2 [Acromyrmex echinatior]